MPRAKNMKYILYLDLDSENAQFFKPHSPIFGSLESEKHEDESFDRYFSLAAILKFRANNLLVMDSGLEGANMLIRISCRIARPALFLPSNHSKFYLACALKYQIFQNQDHSCC
jgi:hypothetical protein